jgi:site-specific recombinase XerD
LSQSSRVAYTGEVVRLAEHLASSRVRRISQVSQAHWQSYLETLVTTRHTVRSRRTEGLKGSSALQAARITRGFLRYCWQEGWISWVPGLGNYRCTAGSEQAAPARAVPAVLAEVLLETHSQNEATARVRSAAALAFWGGLKPEEIAQLRAEHLRSSARTYELTVPGRANAMLVAAPLAKQLDQYRRIRASSIGHEPAEGAALVSQLGSYRALTGNSVWALLRTWPTAIDSVPLPLGAKALRDSFLVLASEASMQRLSAASRLMGRSHVCLPRRAALEVRSDAVADVSLAVLAQLRALRHRT